MTTYGQLPQGQLPQDAMDRNRKAAKTPIPRDKPNSPARILAIDEARYVNRKLYPDYFIDGVTARRRG